MPGRMSCTKLKKFALVVSSIRARLAGERIQDTGALITEGELGITVMPGSGTEATQLWMIPARTPVSWLLRLANTTGPGKAGSPSTRTRTLTPALEVEFRVLFVNRAVSRATPIRSVL